MRYNFFINILDETLATLGIIIGLILISLYKISSTINLATIGFSLFSGCVVYLIIKRKKTYNNLEYNSRSLQLFLECLFLIFFSLSLYFIHTSGTRPAIYFILISLCAGVLAISIYINTSKLGIIIHILKIFVLSLNIKYSIYFYGNGFPGVDSWLHEKMNDELFQVGSTNALSQVEGASVIFGKEFSFPIMHIWTVRVKIVTGTNIKEASNFALMLKHVFTLNKISKYMSNM